MFYQPKSIEEVLGLKAATNVRRTLIAGGTDLVVLVNHGKISLTHLIDLSHVGELRGVHSHNGTIQLGGGVTFAQAARLPIRCLARAALSVGGPGIRELGTLAGNLATASPAGDGSTALLALDAEVELASARGTRRLPLDRFFLGYRRTDLAPDELITKIIVPTGYQSDWAKSGKRGAMNISIVAIAVALTPQKQVRIALASVAATPMRCYKAEALLTQNGLNADTIGRAVELVRSEIKPITDHRASADYKTHLAGVMVRRLLEKLK